MSDITLTITEEEPVSLKIVEAALKPEQEKSVEPTDEPQTVLPDAGCVLSAVHVGAIPPVVLQNKQVTPTKQTQNVTADEGYAGLESVDVEPIPDEYIIPAGKKQISITQNGTTTHDVTEYADAEIIANVNTDPEKGLVFGDYDSDGYPHSARFVGEWTEIPEFFFRYDISSALTSFALCKITSIVVPRGVTKINSNAFKCGWLENVILPDTLTDIRNYAFGDMKTRSIHVPSGLSVIYVDSFASMRYCESFVFDGDITSISRYAFENSGTNVSSVVFDFRNCTSVPTLENVNAFYANVSKIFIVPQALLTTWQNATNWVGVPNATWEGV